ncbi:MAG: helix-turn-helix domain-containing protein [Oscillospiraceae bacterium]|nr:helix-turn-helix domain-containing protein [Oscillospiraceae bacterium]
MDVAGLRAIFSSRIRKLREGKMNQGEFADSVGISRGAMSYYEQELRTPDIGVLRAICEKYKVSADYLLGLMPDTNHAVSDVCLETGLVPKAAKRLNLLQRFKNIVIEEDKGIIEPVVMEFDQDAQEVLELAAFTSAPSMVNLFLTTAEGLTILNMLSAIIVGGEFVTGSDEQPFFRLLTNHKNIEVTFPFENITAALWVNIQLEAAKLKEKIEAANADKPEIQRDSL